MIKTGKRIVVMSLLIAGTMSATAQRGTCPNALDSTNKRSKCTPEMMAERQWKAVNQAVVLDDKTLAKFEPVYKKYQAERLALMPNRANCPMEKADDKGTKQQMTDVDADKLIKARHDRQAKINELDKRYYKEFQKAGLSSKQILRVYQAERTFYVQGAKRQRDMNCSDNANCNHRQGKKHHTGMHGGKAGKR